MVVFGAFITARAEYVKSLDLNRLLEDCRLENVKV